MKRKPPKYLQPLLDHAARLKLRPGDVKHVTILHDKWCAVFRGEPCNCEPVLKDGKPRVA